MLRFLGIFSQIDRLPLLFTGKKQKKNRQKFSFWLIFRSVGTTLSLCIHEEDVCSVRSDACPLPVHVPCVHILFFIAFFGLRTQTCVLSIQSLFTCFPFNVLLQAFGTSCFPHALCVFGILLLLFAHSIAATVNVKRCCPLEQQQQQPQHPQNLILCCLCLCIPTECYTRPSINKYIPQSTFSFSFAFLST